jgi:hypothetical protein
MLGEVVARARKANRGEERGQGREGTTHGSGSNRRWRDGGGRAAARSAALPAAGEQSRVPRARGRRREGRGPGDLFVIFRKFKDLSVN